MGCYRVEYDHHAHMRQDGSPRWIVMERRGEAELVYAEKAPDGEWVPVSAAKDG